MYIAGLQKMTLLDYPGKVACTVFLRGCNFRCPFCHNSGLLGTDAPELMSREDLLNFLGSRRGLLDGVCISGGEPCISEGLAELLRDIKLLGFSVKLDTNGSRPEVLKALLEAGLVDYVAMDVKNSPQEYAKTVGVKDVKLSPIEQSLRYLFSGAVTFELRTTVVEQFHNEDSVRAMGQWLVDLNGGKKVPKIFLQPFVNRDSVLDRNLLPPEKAQISQYVELLYIFAQEVSIRG